MAVAKVIEITSGSKTSFEDAIMEGIKRASNSVDEVTGVWIKDQFLRINNGKISEYRVSMKVTFMVKETTSRSKKK